MIIFPNFLDAPPTTICPSYSPIHTNNTRQYPHTYTGGMGLRWQARTLQVKNDSRAPSQTRHFAVPDLPLVGNLLPTITVSCRNPLLFFFSVVVFCSTPHTLLLPQRFADNTFDQQTLTNLFLFLLLNCSEIFEQHSRL